MSVDGALPRCVECGKGGLPVGFMFGADALEGGASGCEPSPPLPGEGRAHAAHAGAKPCFTVLLVWRAGLQLEASDQRINLHRGEGGIGVANRVGQDDATALTHGAAGVDNIGHVANAF